MTGNPAPALKVRDLRKTWPGPDGGRVEALRLPRLDLARGGTLAVLGESGSGKTTLLHVIAGIVPADEGTVEVLGSRMDGLPEAARDRLRARHVGYLFQANCLLPHLSALENVVLGMAFRPREGEPAPARARAALERVGLGPRLRHRPTQLSAGQRQRVAIARALAGRPDLVLADEPTAHLDPARARESLDLLLDFARECGAAVLVVTHDREVLERIPEHLLLAPPPAEPPADGGRG